MISNVFDYMVSFDEAEPSEEQRRLVNLVHYFTRGNGDNKFPVQPYQIDALNGWHKGCWDDITTKDCGLKCTDGNAMGAFHNFRESMCYYVPEADVWIIYHIKADEWEVVPDHSHLLHVVEPYLANMASHWPEEAGPADIKSRSTMERLRNFTRALHYARNHPYMTVSIDQLRTIHDINRWFVLANDKSNGGDI